MPIAYSSIMHMKKGTYPSKLTKMKTPRNSIKSCCQEEEVNSKPLKTVPLLKCTKQSLGRMNIFFLSVAEKIAQKTPGELPSGEPFHRLEARYSQVLLLQNVISK